MVSDGNILYILLTYSLLFVNGDQIGYLSELCLKRTLLPGAVGVPFSSMIPKSRVPVPRIIYTNIRLLSRTQSHSDQTRRIY